MERDPKKIRAQEKYQQLAGQHRPRPPLFKNTLWAFVIGGLICTAGQAVFNFYRGLGFSDQTAGGPTAATMVFIGTFLTALGVYDEIGRVGGAGSAIPITGFANSIIASAMEFRSEGFVMGVTARMFQIAGPVIVYGVVSALLVGLAKWLLTGG